jgi:hypothetical protein
MNFQHCARVLAVTVGIGISGGALQAVAAPLVQDHDQDSSKNKDRDYSNNKRYQQGVREGQNDHARNRDHSKKRHFTKDEDQKAYETGYQKGHGK